MTFVTLPTGEGINRAMRFKYIGALSPSCTSDDIRDEWSVVDFEKIKVTWSVRYEISYNILKKDHIVYVFVESNLFVLCNWEQSKC